MLAFVPFAAAAAAEADDVADGTERLGDVRKSRAC